jgi:hypothetical protein
MASTNDARTFTPGVLAGHESVKGFAVRATDGRAGRVSWASYASGESYLVVTTGRVRRAHRVVPAGAVTQVLDREVMLSLSRAEIAAAPCLETPHAEVDDAALDELWNSMMLAAGPSRGGM